MKMRDCRFRCTLKDTKKRLLNISDPIVAKGQQATAITKTKRHRRNVTLIQNSMILLKSVNQLARKFLQLALGVFQGYIRGITCSPESCFRLQIYRTESN